jgi:putative nucleotidyltransferase with HDIG domain
VASIVDPTGGLADLASSTLRAVGDPHRRFDEDALRLLRAVRLAAQLKFSIEPQTLDALRAAAPLTVYVSRERVGQEVRRMLQARPPSRGFRLLESTGLLEARFPILAAQRGLPQVKVRGDDLWDHALRTLDAAAEHDPDDEILLLAALLHDIGKPGTRADGHFLGHDQLGSELAMDILTGLAFPRAEIDEVAALVRNHMFGYTPAWSDAAVRRFIRRVGTHRLPRLFALRAADNLGSGMEPDAGGLADLRARTEAELARKPPLEVRDLAIDGRDLQSELGMKPGPRIGAILERLLDSVIADPRRNRRETLIADARAWTNGS